MNNTLQLPERHTITAVDYKNISTEVINDLLKDPEYQDALTMQDGCIEDLSNTLALLDQKEVDEKKIENIQSNRLTALKTSFDALPEGYEELTQADIEQLDTASMMPYVSLVFDSFAFIGDICGLILPKMNNGMAKSLASWVSKCWDGVRAFFKALGDCVKAWVNAQKAKVIIYAFLGGLYVLYKKTTIKNALKAIFSNMSRWDRFWAIAKFVAMVALLVVSAGGEAIARAIRAVANLINVITDIQAIQKDGTEVEPAAVMG